MRIVLNDYSLFSLKEETEVKKDIEWLKEQMNHMHRMRDPDRDPDEWFISKTALLKGVDQLDEPEVLSQEFINEKAVEIYADTADAEVHAVFRIRDLQNLFVPKQELPVIPKFVAEWIEEMKAYNSLRVAFEYIAQRKRDNHDNELAFWVEEGNSETFARAWLDGYGVEEIEYKKVLKVGEMFFSGGGDKHGNFIVELTDNRQVAYVFEDEIEATGIQDEIGGELEEMEE